MTTTKFDQPIILQQSPARSRAIVWAIMGFTTLTVIGACVFKIEEAVPATGKLEPTGAVKEIQVPTGGVVQAIYVKDGQRVKKGARLVTMDSVTSKAQVESLEKIKAKILRENQFYRQILGGVTTEPGQVVGQVLSPDLVNLTLSRSALASENQLYQAQVQGRGAAALDVGQKMRLQARQDEESSRLETARLEVEQLKQQLAQNDVQLANSRELLATNEGILRDLESLAKEGGISKIQYLKQQQDVGTRRAEVQKLIQEKDRLHLAIVQAGEKLQNTAALSQEDVLSKMTNNSKQIAAIDSELSKALLENQKKLDEIESQLSQAKQTLKYQEITSPVDGTVFELKATPGYVASNTAPILKIVPEDTLVAEIYITNKDIGFVREGMDVDVRIDSFPFQQYGDIKGKLIWVGSDALPPDQIYQFYRFPAKVELDRQTLKISGREVALQSGMAVNTNIKLRNRTIMSIFTDLFVQKVETLKFIR